MHQIAINNISLQKRINLLSGVGFLLPVTTLLYTYAGLGIFEIILISNVATFSIWLLELPTSVLADTMGRKTSMVISVCANLLSAICIFLFPTYVGFICAAIFSALYWSFWSGTGQAFLEENLSILNKKKEFGKVIGEFMFMENTVRIFTPLIAGLLLKYLGDSGYKFLAALDVIFSAILVILTLQLKELVPVLLGTFKEMRNKNIDVAKTAFHNVFFRKNMRTLLLYRTFGNHVAYLPLIILPLLVSKGMEDWIGGVVMTIASIFLSGFYKITPRLTSKIGYRKTRLIATGIQGVLLILCGLLFSTSWIVVACIFIVCNAFDGLWQPSRNHVLVQNTSGSSIATMRSLIFSVFALRTTLGKQLLSLFDERTALIILGLFIFLVTIVSSRFISSLDE